MGLGFCLLCGVHDVILKTRLSAFSACPETLKCKQRVLKQLPLKNIVPGGLKGGCGWFGMAGSMFSVTENTYYIFGVLVWLC